MSNLRAYRTIGALRTGLVRFPGAGSMTDTTDPSDSDPATEAEAGSVGRAAGTDFADLHGEVLIALEGAGDSGALAEAVKALGQSERWLRALLSSISDVVSVLDSDGTYVDISSKDPSLLYRPAESLKGKTVHDVFRPEQADFFLEHIRRALSEGRTVECRYELETGGKTRWFSGLVSPLSDTQVVWVARDVTDRKEAETAIKRGEAKFEALFEAGAEAFILVRGDGSIEQVNRRAETLFGYSREELEGTPLDILIPEGRRGAHNEHLRDYVERPRVRRMYSGVVLAGRKKDGTVFPAEISLSHVATGDGVLAMAAVTDVTERKRAEDELRKSMERLRQIDAERGRLLATLVVAQEEERGRIARELHDDAIQVMTAAELRLQTLALRDPSSKEMLNVLGETIRNSIGRLRTSLVGLRPPVLENVGVASALRVHLETMKEHSGLSFSVEDRWEAEPGIETRVTIYRIVLEALNNVRKHAHATSVSVVLEPAEAGFGVEVRDDGRGFDRPASGEGEPGHMGLMIMRERAELAGGELEIASATGEGTTVRFWVPDAPEAVAEPDQPTEADAAD